MAKEFPYFRWYPKDAESDEKYSMMNDAELGFFLRCLNMSWINEGIPADPDDRARVMHKSRIIADKRWKTVGQCFVPSAVFPGKLVNPRQEVERDHARSKSEKGSDSSTSSQKHEPGFMYLAIRNRDKGIKIGSSVNVARRMAQLRYRYKEEQIELVCSIPVNDMNDAETQSHKQFKEKRLTGEWYALSEEDIRQIRLQYEGDTEGDTKGDTKGELDITLSPPYHPDLRARARIARYAYDSDSYSSVTDNGSVKTNGKHSGPEVLDSELQEVSEAFDRHLKHLNREPKDLVIQLVMSMNGQFDWNKFRQNHKPFCEHWDTHGWSYCTLSFLGWINANMPPPPPKAKTARELREEERLKILMED